MFKRLEWIAFFLLAFFVGRTVLAQTDEIWAQVAARLQAALAANKPVAHRLERVAASEDEDNIKIARLMFETQMFQYARGKEHRPDSTIAVRDAHAKGHGCVVATFTVNEGVPEWARSGVFAVPGRVYQGLIRFSNGTGQQGVADTAKDGRGMAIKLVDAENLGVNLLGNGRTQDFMLINNDRFFIRNTADYLQFQASTAKTRDVKAFIAIRAIHEALGEDVADSVVQQLLPQIAALAAGQASAVQEIVKILGPEKGPVLFAKLEEVKKGAAPLEQVIMLSLAKEIESNLKESYFSMVPYALGDTAVKYATEPVACGQDVKFDQRDENFLSADLITRVSRTEHCFKFFLQPLPQTDLESQRTLVEDSRLRFGTEKVEVATIRIPKQDISPAAKTRYCENLSYNPWQAQPEHRPLGGMNRSRRVAVTASSIRRHLLNQAERQEPVSVKEYEELR